MHNSEEEYWGKHFEYQGEWGRRTGNLVEAIAGRVVPVGPRIERRRRATIIKALSLREDDTLLDAGCGFGDFILPVLHERCGLLGLDFSLPMLRTARERILQATGKSLPFVGGSISQIPLKDDCVDVVYCRGVLHHIPDDKVEGFWYAGVPRKKSEVGDTELSLDGEGLARREPASLPAGAARS
jgi:SAM-dependent methyltransferase